MKLYHNTFRNRDIITSFGTMHVDDKGVAEVSEATARAFSTIPNFSAIEEKDVQKPKQDTVSVPKTETTTAEVNTPYEEHIEAAENKAEPDTDINEIKSMNTMQLKKYAREHGIDTTGASKKDELLALILGE